jgi:hypothetical protein
MGVEALIVWYQPVEDGGKIVAHRGVVVLVDAKPRRGVKNEDVEQARPWQPARGCKNLIRDQVKATRMCRQFYLFLKYHGKKKHPGTLSGK